MMGYIPFPDIAPEIFSISIGGFELALRWYALAYIAGLILGWRLVVALMQRPALWGGVAPMAPARVEDLLTWVILGVVLGGRLGFVLFYQPGYYLAHPLEIPAVWQGGMSFHGGFLGVVLAAWVWAGRNGVPRLALADALDPTGWLGEPLPEIARRTGLPLVQVQAVLRRVQQIEPAGLFARDLAECLTLQARAAEMLDA
ncbi:MAG: prolipoprotein diacylglyceryl transferase family protein, partial [Gemmobacter sp.]